VVNSTDVDLQKIHCFIEIVFLSLVVSNSKEIDPHKMRDFDFLPV